MANITNEGEIVSLIELLKPYQEILDMVHFKMHEITMAVKERKEVKSDIELELLYKQKKNGKVS